MTQNDWTEEGVKVRRKMNKHKSGEARESGKRRGRGRRGTHETEYQTRERGQGRGERDTAGKKENRVRRKIKVMIR